MLHNWKLTLKPFKTFWKFLKFKGLSIFAEKNFFFEKFLWPQLAPPPIKTWLRPWVEYKMKSPTIAIWLNNLKRSAYILSIYSTKNLRNYYESYTVMQWFSTWGTRVICDTLTKKLWHFAIIFMWHSWSKNIKKMTPRQKKV